MNDSELLIRYVLPGIALSLPLYGVGWLLTKSGRISDKVAQWVFYSLGSGVFGFFTLGIVFSNLGLPTRLLITFVIWVVAMMIGLLIARI